MAASHMTTDHDLIRHWAESRGGKPATIRGADKGDETAGIPLIDFPSYAGEGRLEYVTWDRFFQTFDDQSLAMVYQEQTDRGEQSRLSRFVARPEGILDTLRVEHDQVIEVLDEMLQTSSRAKKSRHELLRQLKMLLVPHMKAEEQLFYPRLRKKGHQDDDVLEAYEEHWLATQALTRLDKSDTADEIWHARAKVLKDVLEHHIEEEQDVLFDLAREVMDSRDMDALDESYLNAEDKQKSRLRAA